MGKRKGEKEMQELFEKVLDKDETILKVFKPNKRKLYWSVFLIYLFSFAWIAVPAIISVIVDGYDATVKILGSLAIVVGLAIVYLFVWLLAKVYYNKLFYAYSNKRIIIRTGIFGVDYKSLDMGMIGAVNVYVSLLDKLLRKDTGSITFGSMASPMVTASGSGSYSAGYRFANIEMPYETYREVKSVIDEFKANKN